jgi:GNAT superfamily N-acetyltransferase
MLDRALGFGAIQPVTEADLDIVGAFFADRARNWWLPLGPNHAVDETARLLERRGFTRDYAWAKFRCATRVVPVARTELRVEDVDEARARDFAHVAVSTFGLAPALGDWVERVPGRDGWDCFGAFDGDALVATGALHVADRVGWLGFAATLPAYRGRGAQNALLARRIERAAERGCEVVTTETGESVDGRVSSSYRNIIRAGCELAYVRPNWAAPQKR